MAAIAAAARLTQAHRTAQLHLTVDTTTRMLDTWAIIDPANLDATAHAWLRVALPIIDRAHSASSTLAAKYFEAFRTLELGLDAEPAAAILAAPIDHAAVTTSLTVTGPIRTKLATARGLLLDQAAEAGAAGAAEAAGRIALNGGRTTLLRSVDGDRHALGWARVASGKACAFCAMLAGRGPVYRADTADFQAHDGCACTAEPVYHRDAPWPDGADTYRQLWQDSTDGLNGDDALAAFRQALAA